MNLTFALDDLGAPPAALLHLTCGPAIDPLRWRQAGVDRVSLLTGDAALVDRVRARGDDGLRAAFGAGATGPGAEVAVRRYNLPDLDSVSPPQPLLLHLFPGLRQTGTDRLPVVDVADLAAALPAPAAPQPGGGAPVAARVLVLAVPGQALMLLRQLDRASRLQGFDRILVQEGTEPLYEGAASLDTIADWLAAAGFARQEIDSGLDGADPDRPWLRADRPRRHRAERGPRPGGARRPVPVPPPETPPEPDAAESAATGPATVPEPVAVPLADLAPDLAPDLAAAQAEVARLTDDLAAARARIAALEAEHVRLQDERQKSGVRQDSLRAELQRAEGQLALLRDLLIREPGL